MTEKRYPPNKKDRDGIEIFVYLENADVVNAFTVKEIVNEKRFFKIRETSF